MPLSRLPRSASLLGPPLSPVRTPSLSESRAGMASWPFANRRGASNPSLPDWPSVARALIRSRRGDGQRLGLPHPLFRERRLLLGVKNRGALCGFDPVRLAGCSGMETLGRCLRAGPRRFYFRVRRTDRAQLCRGKGAEKTAAMKVESSEVLVGSMVSL
jgi:hypothetical protein